ncbi:hypothetical protein JIG36_06450 [Actinoplanes sp. LDG1-06]|uniref:Uncharacterized protein n=1 Tax=Paractinoplanes ovalisporus TaxID=2810368 RepID=A0ABS2A5T5_9ACTN|nr:hypothetical protein [Actinoplanes ovalisporus]MBM2615202.1 hypothetical protein [Actinoplanes ovalisporus]
MNERDTALWWARIRSGGPQRVATGGPTPDGLRRIVEADAQAVWLIPDRPESAGPAVLAEYGVPGPAMLDSKGTLRVLAACVRCCWPDPATDPWPGAAATLDQVDQVLQRLVPGRNAVSRKALLTGASRRLAAAGWLLLEGADTVRLGPRIASYGNLELSTLRELWRMVPA